jgi:hypothetical protein
MTNKRYCKWSMHSLVLMAYDPRHPVVGVWCWIMLCLDGNRKTDASILQLLPMRSHNRINKMNVYFSFISHNTGTLLRNNLVLILLNTISCQMENEYTRHKTVHYHSTGSAGLLE